MQFSAAVINSDTHTQLNIHKLMKLLASQRISLVKQMGGGNSKVYCIDVEGERLALKCYPAYAPGKRDRLAAELQAYQFLNAHQITSVPQLKAYSEEERWLVMSWIEGALLQTYSSCYVQQAIDFIGCIANLNSHSEAKQLPLAAEACLSLNIIIKQIEARLQNLQHHANDESSLLRFLDEEFQPAFTALTNEALRAYEKNALDPEALLDENNRSLIPADFGFHNAILDSNNKLYFFDFDYFGWDDPVKLLADILWHPKMHLTEGQREQFVRGISAIYAGDLSFPIRFTSTVNLFGLRWTLILLNEFIPAFWDNRTHAEAHKNAANPAEVKSQQLKRATALLQKCLTRISP